MPVPRPFSAISRSAARTIATSRSRSPATQRAHSSAARRRAATSGSSTSSPAPRSWSFNARRSRATRASRRRHRSRAPPLRVPSRPAPSGLRSERLRFSSDLLWAPTCSRARRPSRTTRRTALSRSHRGSSNHARRSSRGCAFREPAARRVAVNSSAVASAPPAGSRGTVSFDTSSKLPVRCIHRPAVARARMHHRN
jgi:hypothetical protein